MIIKKAVGNSMLKKVSVQKAFDKFKPESCVFVISVDSSGRPSGMIAGWKTRCSYEPPLIAVVLSKKGYTHEIIQQSKEFVIAIPNKGLEKEVNYFGSKSGRVLDKFKETCLKTSKARFIKSPLIREATINFECKLFKKIDIGDHVMFIGRVLAAYINKNKKILLNVGKIRNKHIFKEL